MQAESGKRKETIENKQKPQTQQISYIDMIKAFVEAGCIKLEKSTDKQDTLMSKYRQQLKKMGLTPEKAYKYYDEEDLRFVFKNDFVVISNCLEFDFTDEELVKIFTLICNQGTEATKSKDQQEQVASSKPISKTGTRFNLQQFTATVSDNKDENWLYQAYIKIHSVVLQKSLTYKRLFNQWREKNSKTQAGRLTKQELIVGLKRLKAGLTQDEINRLCEVQPYDGRDTSTGYQEF